MFVEVWNIQKKIKGSLQNLIWMWALKQSKYILCVYSLIFLFGFNNAILIWMESKKPTVVLYFPCTLVGGKLSESQFLTIIAPASQEGGTTMVLTYTLKFRCYELMHNIRALAGESFKEGLCHTISVYCLN